MVMGLHGYGESQLWGATGMGSYGYRCPQVWEATVYGDPWLWQTMVMRNHGYGMVISHGYVWGTTVMGSHS